MRLSSLSLAGGLAAALLLVPATSAQAAVSAKDAPSQADIVKVFPELADAEFATDKTKQVGVPGKTCGVPGMEKVKSASSTAGASAAGFPVVAAGVAEIKSAAKAKGYLKSYKAYVKACPTFTEPNSGATVTVSAAKAPKLGQESLAMVQETSVLGTIAYSSTVVIRDGNRMATVLVIDDAPVSASAINKLAKVAAKKMK
ncbi:hypothetical protein GCM10023339_21380 [Alloalcanivorax gelatiniphagus]